MKKFARLTPEGTRDVLFQDARAENEVSRRLRDCFERYGYRTVRTPAIEYYDVFGVSDKYFPQESMYKTVDRNGRLIVMRPDSTIPIARLVATKLRGGLMPQRLAYDQMVFRAGQSLNGIAHEMHQSGVELIGAKSAKSDCEMLALAAATLAALGISDYRLEIGHVGVVEGLLKVLGADDETKGRIADALEGKQYSHLRDALLPFAENPAARLLARLPRLFGGREVLKEVRALFAPVAKECLPILDELDERVAQAEAMGIGEHIIIDFGLANQADYYSGIVFKGYVGGAAVAVLSGGRYDHLLSDFGLEAPAIGFGVRVDILAELLAEAFGNGEGPWRLLYAAPEDVGAALTWRAKEPGKIVLSLAESLEEAQMEALARKATALVVYRNGLAEEWGVGHA